MYIYDKQSDRIHRNHTKHSNLENRYFRYIRPQKSPKIAQKSYHSIANHIQERHLLSGRIFFCTGQQSLYFNVTKNTQVTASLSQDTYYMTIMFDNSA